MSAKKKVAMAEEVVAGAIYLLCVGLSLLPVGIMKVFNPPPQEVSIFCKVEMNCERLDRVLILDYTNICPDNQGT